jgi:hypothetical protein
MAENTLLTSKTLFLRWQEELSEFTGWQYAGAGSGAFDPTFKPVTVTRWARWCSEDTEARRQQGIEWIKAGRPESQLVLVDEDAEDWRIKGLYEVIYSETPQE